MGNAVTVLGGFEILPGTISTTKTSRHVWYTIFQSRCMRSCLAGPVRRNSMFNVPDDESPSPRHRQ